MRLETLAELIIEATEEFNNDFLLAERVKELVADHKADEAELEDLDLDSGCESGACFL